MKRERVEKDAETGNLISHTQFAIKIIFTTQQSIAKKKK